MAHLHQIAAITTLSLAIMAMTTYDARRSSTSPAAIPKPTPGPGDHSLSTLWNGQKRNFMVHAPPDYDGKTPLPLVVTMHDGSLSDPDAGISATDLMWDFFKARGKADGDAE